MNVRRSTTIWEAGKRLDEAWYHFASDEDRDAMDSLPTFVEAATAKMLDTPPKPSVHPLKVMADAFLAGNYKLQQRQEITERLQSDLLDALYDGDLVATGYRVAPSPSRSPVQIDPNLFDDAEADWKNSIVRGLGEEFRNVRITDRADLSGTSVDKPKGRPGSGVAIAAAIERVALRNPEFCKLNRGKAAQLLRDELAVGDNTGNGLSDKNLAKYILVKCGSKRIIK